MHILPYPKEVFREKKIEPLVTGLPGLVGPVLWGFGVVRCFVFLCYFPFCFGNQGIPNA
jgi:hypothetical protein